tara:strand:- start:229 stop:558 length:330 start_codon:yes stop_codon:yes gene_type:complete
MANNVLIFVDQGSDFTANIDVKHANGVVTDLSTYTINASFKKSYGTSQTHSFTTTKTNAANGNMQIKLTAETSSNVAFGRYVYDVVIDSSDLDITRRVQEGILTIKPGV